MVASRSCGSRDGVLRRNGAAAHADCCSALKTFLTRCCYRRAPQRTTSRFINFFLPPHTFCPFSFDLILLHASPLNY